MAMSSLLWKNTPITFSRQPIERSKFRYKHTCYTPPTSSRFPPSPRLCIMHDVKPIYALVKGNSGFVGNTNTSDRYGPDSYLFWSNLNQNDNKLICNWRKADAVADAEEDTGSKRTNSPTSERRYRRKRHPKLYAVVVGASFFVVVGLCFLRFPQLCTARCVEVPYSDLVSGIRDESVTRVQFLENSRRIYFNTKSLEDQTQATDLLARQFWGATKLSSPKWQYHTRNVEDDKYEVLRLLKEKEITYGSKRALVSASMKSFLFTFFQVAPFWIMVLLTFYQLSVQLDLGKLTKRKPSKKQSVTFDDVKGVDAAKTELLEVVLCMKKDKKYMKLGAKLPRGILLTGPPGTGKTLLARAVAGEVGVSFFSISASELVEVFVGRGAARVRDLFREARKNSPSIVFIDEIDAVGGQRGRTLNCERDQTLNQLLTEMDGFDKEENVVVIAATNRPETLDSALMRPGRFSRKVSVEEPDECGRREIFELYLRDVPMEENKEAISQVVASLTPGLVGADLENIAREAVLLAARKGGEFVRKEDILEAVGRGKGKYYDERKSFSFRGGGAASEDGGGSGSMGFGFSN